MQSRAGAFSLSLSRALSRSLALSLARSLARSIALSLARSLSQVRGGMLGREADSTHTTKKIQPIPNALLYEIFNANVFYGAQRKNETGSGAAGRVSARQLSPFLVSAGLGSNAPAASAPVFLLPGHSAFFTVQRLLRLNLRKSVN